MESLIHPAILYTGLGLGAIGVALAMPRQGGGPQVLGALIAAVFIGAVVLAMAIAAGDQRPNVFFYVFALISLGASLRVITHPRPVYAALYFILTVLSSAGLYLLLSAEFLTFALVIIYAGAILITYLFVIMLATQAPEGGATEALTEYDSTSREPWVSTVTGFVLLGLLTGMLSTGVTQLTPPEARGGDAVLAAMPRKVERAFAEVGLAEQVMPFRAGPLPRSATKEEREAFSLYFPPTAGPEERPIDAMLRPIDIADFRARFEAAREVAAGETPPAGVKPLDPEAFALINENGIMQDGPDSFYVLVSFPEGLRTYNIEKVGYALLAEHPLAIELAGVILLLALVGAVILARKQIEIAEAEKAEAVGATMGRAA